MIKKKIIFIIAFTTILSSSYANVKIVKAEGSRDLVKNGGYRPYTWATDTNSAGIVRKTFLKVYVKAGEKIYLGSSVNINAGDIKVKDPSGLEKSYDVLSSGKGYINTVAKESAGSLPNPGGYDPIIINVNQTGIWEVEFIGDVTKTANPTFKYATSEFISEQQGTVAAWDITVRDESGVEKYGRVFTSYVSIFMGANSKEHTKKILNSDFYVLTKDGYVYKTSMNGIDPNGFIFFSNNRGVVDKTNNMTLYHSIYSKDNGKLPSLGDALGDLVGNVAPQLPNVPDTITNITHSVFFNEPSKELPKNLSPTAIAPAQASDFNFKGAEGIEKKSKIAEGGIFKFNSDKPSSYKLIIDTDKDGKFDPIKDKVIENVAIEGTNTVLWDGKDKQGDDLPIGNYSAKLTMKGGEYHFPLIDAEYNPFGVKVELLNAPGEFPEGINSTTVYYDESDYMTANGTMVDLNAAGSGNEINPTSPLNGVDSVSGAHNYLLNLNDSIGGKGGYGNWKGIDTWTYFPGNSIVLSFDIVDKYEEPNGSICGYIFNDKNKDTILNYAEPGLNGINVSVTDKNGKVHETVTDATGYYAVSIPQGQYTLKVNSMDGYNLTTNNSTQSDTLNESTKIATNVGYYVEIDLSIESTVSTSSPVNGQEVTYTLIAKNNTSMPATNVVVKDSIPAGLEYIRDTSNGKYDPNTGNWIVEDLIAGETKTISITAKVNSDLMLPVAINNIATISCTEPDNNKINNTSSVIITPVANTAPTAPNYEKTTEYNTKVEGTVVGTDANGDTLTYSITDANKPANGTVTINETTGKWEYTPKDGFSGNDDFKVTVDDGKGEKTDSIVTIKVNQAVNTVSIVEIIGTITNEKTAEVIPGCTVILKDLSGKVVNQTTTDNNGSYSFKDVVKGEFILTVENPKYTSGNVQFSTQFINLSDPTVRQDMKLVNYKIDLVANPSTIVGDGKSKTNLTSTVLDKNGEPVEGVIVTFSADGVPNGNFSSTTAVTNKEGKATVMFTSENISGVVPKVVPVKAQVDDNIRELHATEQILITFEPGSIKGIVTDNLGNPIEGAEIVISKDFNNDGITDFYSKVVTGTDGGYVIAVPKGNVNYELSIKKPVQVGNTTVIKSFEQSAFVGNITGLKDDVFNSNKVATGLILEKYSDSTANILQDYSKYNMDVYGTDNSGNINFGNVVEGVNASISNDGDSKGVFKVNGLEKGKTYELAITYTFPNGEKIIVGTLPVTVKDDGQINICSALIDPYGIVVDAVTKKPIIDANTTLYYANTQNNIEKGKTPNTPVILPTISGFDPNDNKNPQNTNKDGAYAFMVYPKTDYYIVVSKPGYNPYTTENIHVDMTIVHNKDILLQPIVQNQGNVVVQPNSQDNGNVVTQPTNNSPSVENYNVTTTENKVVVGKIIGLDPNNDILSYSKGIDPTNGIMTVDNTGNWTYTPNNNFIGVDSFTIKVEDGHGGLAVSKISITVTKINNIPSIENYTVATIENKSVTGKAVGTDEDNDALTYTKGSNPVHGKVNVDAKGTWEYTPDNDFIGKDSFTINLKDEKGGVAVSTITVLVEKGNLIPLNNIPKVNNYKTTTVKNTAVSGTVVGKDEDNDKLIFSQLNSPKHGSVWVKEDGTWIYVPDKDYLGVDSFKVIVNDGKGGSAISSVDILIEKTDIEIKNPIELPKTNLDTKVKENKSEKRLAKNSKNIDYKNLDTNNKITENKQSKNNQYKLPKTGGILDFKMINTLGEVLIGIGFILTGRRKKK